MAASRSSRTRQWAVKSFQSVPEASRFVSNRSYIMSDQIVPVPPAWKGHSFLGAPDYAALYAESIKDPDGFWRKQAARLDWIKPFTKVSDVSWKAEDLHVRWFED